MDIYRYLGNDVQELQQQAEVDPESRASKAPI